MNTCIVVVLTFMQHVKWAYMATQSPNLNLMFASRKIREKS